MSCKTRIRKELLLNSSDNPSDPEGTGIRQTGLVGWLESRPPGMVNSGG